MSTIMSIIGINTQSRIAGPIASFGSLCNKTFLASRPAQNRVFEEEFYDKHAKPFNYSITFTPRSYSFDFNTTQF